MPDQTFEALGRQALAIPKPEKANRRRRRDRGYFAKRLHAFDFEFLEPIKFRERRQGRYMRQPRQFNPAEIARPAQGGEIRQIIHLEDFDGFKFGEMSDKPEVDRLAKTEKQRSQMFEWLQTGQVRQRYAGDPKVA